jgi:hypothetical protein
MFSAFSFLQLDWSNDDASRRRQVSKKRAKAPMTTRRRKFTDESSSWKKPNMRDGMLSWMQILRDFGEPPKCRRVFKTARAPAFAEKPSQAKVE